MIERFDEHSGRIVVNGAVPPDDGHARAIHLVEVDGVTHRVSLARAG